MSLLVSPEEYLSHCQYSLTISKFCCMVIHNVNHFILVLINAHQTIVRFKIRL